MRFLISLITLSLAVSGLAEDSYSSLSAPELRTKIARIGAVHEENWYQVEVFIFARTSPNGPEYWRLDQRPQLAPENAIVPSDESPFLPENSDAIDRAAATLGAWRLIPPKELILIDMLGRMENSGDYRTLYHAGWVQPIRKHSHAFPIYIQGGKHIAMSSAAPAQEQNLDYGLPLLEMESPGTSAQTDDGKISTTIAATKPELQGMLRLHLSRYLHVEPDLWFTSTSQEDQSFWVKIDQKRRMRSEELHYLDHPLFGALIRITPFQTTRQKELEKMKAALKAK